MVALSQIDVPQEELTAFCRHNGIQRLSFFGSVVRDDFGPESDIDVLVEFAPGRTPGLIGFAGLEMELTELLGRRVDLNTPGSFRPALREKIQSEAVPRYVDDAR